MRRPRSAEKTVRADRLIGYPLYNQTGAKLYLRDRSTQLMARLCPANRKSRRL